MSAPLKPQRQVFVDRFDVTERWRNLMPGQRKAVVESLFRELYRFERLARARRMKANSSPPPFSSTHGNAAVAHAANAGACNIAIEMLQRIGGHP